MAVWPKDEWRGKSFHARCRNEARIGRWEIRKDWGYPRIEDVWKSFTSRWEYQYDYIAVRLSSFWDLWILLGVNVDVARSKRSNCTNVGSTHILWSIRQGRTCSERTGVSKIVSKALNHLTDCHLTVGGLCKFASVTRKRLISLASPSSTRTWRRTMWRRSEARA